jgi:site-specific recombinase XerD
MTQSRLVEQFEKHLIGTDMAPATVANYLADLRDFAAWLDTSEAVSTPSSDPLIGVGADHIRSYCSALRGQGRSTATINRRLQAVRKFYDFAAQQGLCSQNPAREVERLTERTTSSPRVLEDGQVDMLLSAAAEYTDGLRQRNRAILLVLLDTGIKVQELIDLRVYDLDLSLGRGQVRVHQDLSLAGRRLQLSPETSAALQAYLQVRSPALGVDHLFVSRRGRPLSARSLQRLVTECARAAGLEGVSARTFRQTFAHDALQHSEPSEVAQMLGLRDTSGIRRYRA